jgi:hypothetical protein
LVEYKLREAFEGENVEPRVALQRTDIFVVGRASSRAGRTCCNRLARTLAPPAEIQQLAFELKRRLLGREQQQRQAIWRRAQMLENLGQAAVSFAAAGGAEQEPDVHTGFLRKDAKAQRILFHYIFGGWTAVV